MPDDRAERIRAALGLMPPETRDAIRRMCHYRENIRGAGWLDREELFNVAHEATEKLRSNAATELGRLVAEFPAEPIPATNDEDAS